MHVIVWEFRVKSEHEADFVEVYGPHGAWAKLFRRHQDFVATELLCDSDKAGRYLTIDKWQTKDAYDSFRSSMADEYIALDKRCDAWTNSETLIGHFSAVT